MAKRGPKPKPATSIKTQERGVSGDFAEKISIPIDFDKTIKTWRSELAKALGREGKARGETAMQHVAVAFFEDKTIMVSVLKHMLPQLKAVELKGDADAPFKLIIELGATNKDKSEEDGTETDK